MKTIFIYEWKNFLRNQVMVGSWIAMLLIGSYAIYYGNVSLNDQRDIILQIDTAYQSRTKVQLENFAITDTINAETKAAYQSAHVPLLNEYALRPMIWKAPAPLQALSIGQADTQPFYYNLWMYYNVYSNKQPELTNPAKLKAGNFDLAFVFVYLFPLLLIAYCFDVSARDKEAGIEKLLIAQGISLHRLAIGRLLLRVTVVLSLAFILSAAGFLVNGVSQAVAVAGWLLITAVYLIFWVAVVYLVTALGKSSGLSALILVGIWVLLVLLIPSMVNKIVPPVQVDYVAQADAEREYGSYIWDMDKSRLLDTLHQVKPSWKDYAVTDSNEMRNVAYLFFNMANLNRIGQIHDSLVSQAQNGQENFNYINPAFCAQVLYNRLAETEAGNYLHFRASAASYQLQRNEIISDFRMSKREFTKSAFTNIGGYEQRSLQLGLREWSNGILPLIVLSIMAAVAGYFTWVGKKIFNNQFNNI